MRTCPKCGKQYPDDAEFCVKDGTHLDDDDVLFDDPAPARERSLGGPIAPGDVVGSYKVVDKLGKGGMGIVYLAQHTRLGRRVALKVLRPEFGEDPLLVRRFFDEARAANQVGHENIVEIFDFVEQGEHRYYVMELLEGESLAQAMSSERALSLGRAFRIARQVADALAAVHDKGIVHRDLKPDNIFLVQRSRKRDFVKLLDFGIAKLMDRTGDEVVTAQQTQAGMMLGTPAYMSPEQLKAERVDHRADIYAFGVILYQMVTGVRPFRAKSVPELMMLHCSAPPPPLSSVFNLPHEIPGGLETLIMACLEKEPTMRPESMHDVDEMLEALEADCAGMLTPEPQMRVPTDPGLVPRPKTNPGSRPITNPGLGARPPTNPGVAPPTNPNLFQQAARTANNSVEDKSLELNIEGATSEQQPVELGSDDVQLITKPPTQPGKRAAQPSSSSNPRPAMTAAAAAAASPIERVVMEPTPMPETAPGLGDVNATDLNIALPAPPTSEPRLRYAAAAAAALIVFVVVAGLIAFSGDPTPPKVPDAPALAVAVPVETKPPAPAEAPPEPREPPATAPVERAAVPVESAAPVAAASAKPATTTTAKPVAAPPVKPKPAAPKPKPVAKPKPAKPSGELVDPFGG